MTQPPVALWVLPWDSGASRGFCARAFFQAFHETPAASCGIRAAEGSEAVLGGEPLRAAAGWSA